MLGVLRRKITRDTVSGVRRLQLSKKDVGPCLGGATTLRDLHQSSMVLRLLTSLVRSSTMLHSNERSFSSKAAKAAKSDDIAPRKKKWETQKKVEVKEPSGVRLNEQIRADFIRLVTDEGHTVLSRNEALQRAKNLDFDLVEVDRNAKPPVCKIMDYHKERYMQQLKDKERAKNKSEVSIKKGVCKEVHFAPKAEPRDLKMKAETALRLMERGYRVRCVAKDKQNKEGLDFAGALSRFFPLVEDVVIVESGPHVERRQAYVIVRHVKFGPSKKGGKKEFKIDSTAFSEKLLSASTDTEETNSGESSGQYDDEAYSPLEGEQQSTWSPTDANNDFDDLFDLKHDVMGKSASTGQQMKFGKETPATNNNAAGLPPPRVPNFTSPNTRPPPPQAENRYARNATRDASSGRSSARFSNSGSQHQAHSNISRAGVPRQAVNDSVSSRNLQPPHQVFSQARVDSANQERKSEPSGGGHTTKSTGYGIFSAPKGNVNQGSGNKTNQPRGTPFDSTQNSGKHDQPDRNEGSGDSGPSDSGKWGVFSRNSK